MANITPIQLTSDNSNVLTLVAATAGGDTVINVTTSPETVLLVNNGSGSSITVTLTAAVACNQGVTHNVAVTVAAGKQAPIKLPAQVVNASSQVVVAYSAATSVTVAAYKH